MTTLNTSVNAIVLTYLDHLAVPETSSRVSPPQEEYDDRFFQMFITGQLPPGTATHFSSNYEHDRNAWTDIGFERIPSPSYIGLYLKTCSNIWCLDHDNFKVFNIWQVAHIGDAEASKNAHCWSSINVCEVDNCVVNKNKVFKIDFTNYLFNSYSGPSQPLN